VKKILLQDIKALAYNRDMKSFVLVYTNCISGYRGEAKHSLTATEADAFDTYLNIIKDELSKTENQYSRIAWRSLVLPSVTIEAVRLPEGSPVSQTELVSQAQKVEVYKNGSDFANPWGILNVNRVISHDGYNALIVRPNDVVLATVNYTAIDEKLPPGLDKALKRLDKVVKSELVPDADLVLERGDELRLVVGGVDLRALKYILDNLPLHN
jgi:hypothetical protein